MTDIDETITTYLTACAVEGKSPNTVWSYRTSLADFRRVGNKLALPDTLEAYTVYHVYAFLNDLRVRGAGSAYQHRRHREVKSFFSWCKRLELVSENVFARVPLVKLEQQIIQPLTRTEIATLLRNQDRNVHHDCRNYALLLFLLDTGVRAAECIAVNLEDVDWERRRVRVLHGKPCSSRPQDC